MDTERRRSRDYHWLLGDKSDPNKITIKIERQIWKHVRHDDEGRRSWHVEGVTVCSGRCRLAGCNAAARSGMVEYEHLLPPQPAEVLGHDARDHVWAARCRPLRDQLHRRCRVVLRLRRERPSSRRAAEKRDELATFHSITSSASNCNELGTSSPSARAVCILITNSNLVDCTTGRLAGFAPFRIRPVYTPT